LGRGIVPQDGNPGAAPVFVMNYRFWQSEFGGDPKILGKSFAFYGKPATLVGVMPAYFNAFNASYWLPVSAERGGKSLEGGGTVMGRLKPGVSVTAAAADLDAIAHQVRMANPDGTIPGRFAIVSRTLLDSLIGGFKKTLYALLAAVFLLLLIACANVANLLLALKSSEWWPTSRRAG
jgi:putative ABC transport system permease protein